MKIFFITLVFGFGLFTYVLYPSIHWILIKRKIAVIHCRDIIELEIILSHPAIAITWCPYYDLFAVHESSDSDIGTNTAIHETRIFEPSFESK
jgi:hypothetical protein